MKFEKWNAEKVKVSAEGKQATGTMRPSDWTTLYTNSIVGRRTLKIHVRTLDKRQMCSSLIQLGVVFSDTDFDTWLWNNENAWCLCTGGAVGFATELRCRGKQSETNEMLIRNGSTLQMKIDSDNKSIEFTVDQVTFPPIKMDITDLQSRQLCPAVRMRGTTQIEVSGE